ncbi:MAG: excinuclease ABC subunit UvrC [Candidatus Aenigmarchaeota archaeon]|nr:excinuclease ABC subunit UvrC [Candidatus Aenigmarchaeota archaeon]
MFEIELKNVPKEPGVYMFKRNDDILYIGKAKNLRNRIKSYFSKNNLALKTKHLMSKANAIDWIVVNNEVEALLLENKLIKKNKPKYNINLKDSKTFAYIALTKEKFPRILTSRKISTKLDTFGPYTDGYLRQDLERMVSKVFKIRVCRKMPKRACLNFHIGTCLAPCIGKITKEEYMENIENAKAFLSGDYERTLESLNKQMKNESKNKRYECAMEIRNQIQSIKLLEKKQIVDRELSFDQDILAFRKLDEKMIIVQMGVRKGVLLGKKEFKVDYQDGVEQEFLKAFYTANKLPREVLLSHECWEDIEEKVSLEKMLTNIRSGKVSLTVPKKGDKLLLVELAKKNIDANLKEDSSLLEIKEKLNLPSIPRIIECFDVSNLSGEHLVSGMVRFANAKPDKKNYRKFKIKTVKGQDDFASIKEAVSRRYKRLLEEKSKMPDLIVIDGGSLQVDFAAKALCELGLQIPLIGIAKQNEEIYLPGEQEPRSYKKTGRMMLLLRRIRDEAHRFSIGYNKKRREMQLREEFRKK